MLSYKSVLRISLLSLTALALAFTMPVRAEKPVDKTEPEMNQDLSENDKRITAIGTATKLLDYGLENKKPEAVATAIIMLVDNHVKSTEEADDLLKTNLTESLAKAKKADKGDAHEKLLKIAEERIGELGKTKGVQGGPHSFAGRVAPTQTNKVGNGYIYLKGWCTLTVKNVRPNDGHWIKVTVRGTRPGTPIVAENWGHTVTLRWWSPDRETYNIWVHYHSGKAAIDYVGYTN